MAKIAHLRIFDPSFDGGTSHVHFDQMHNSYTLCGLEIDGDSHLGLTEAEATTDPVDCHQCIRIVKLCKRIKGSEYK